MFICKLAGHVYDWTQQENCDDILLERGKVERGLGGAAFKLAWFGWLVKDCAPSNFTVGLRYPVTRPLRQVKLPECKGFVILKCNKRRFHVEHEEVTPPTAFKALGFRNESDLVLGYD